MTDPHVKLLQQSIKNVELPELFTYPYYYQPHTLCLIAVDELKKQLMAEPLFDMDEQDGKMFGVLIVKTRNDELGYLSAYSGQMQCHVPDFVPALYDINGVDTFFDKGQGKVNQITAKLKKLEANPDIADLSKIVDQKKHDADDEIAKFRQKMIVSRQQRKAKRKQSLSENSEAAHQTLLVALAKESVAEKNALKEITARHRIEILKVEKAFLILTDEISQLKRERQEVSKAVQQQLFEQYQFLNAKGRQQSLLSLFKATTRERPPAGSGDCAGPKLLQYAYENKMKPLAMAEFWWGKSPQSEIRHHGQFYGACQGKCKPILTHMLEGLTLEPNPFLTQTGKVKPVEVLYKDDVLLVINKPAGLLSVPGKEIEDCVASRLKLQLPDIPEPLIVHRLDMATSGLMVLALNKLTHKKLQKQFIERTVAKRYIAVLDGVLERPEGEIDLPLRVDLDDRPRQLVCQEYGKAAKTKWQVIDQLNGQTAVYFYPMTGRTHQLRVHAAHQQGLNMPIVGDDLYGTKDKRLYLHAERLVFEHPMTKESVTFQVDANFSEDVE